MIEPPGEAKSDPHFTTGVRTALAWIEEALYIIVGLLLLAAAVLVVVGTITEPIPQSTSPTQRHGGLRLSSSPAGARRQSRQSDRGLDWGRAGPAQLHEPGATVATTDSCLLKRLVRKPPGVF